MISARRQFWAKFVFWSVCSVGYLLMALGLVTLVMWVL